MPIPSTILHDLHRAGFDRKITPEEINRLPITQYTGHIEMITTVSALENVLGILLQETLIGFDTETKPAFRKGERNPVAIIQCATGTTVYIIQLRNLPSLRPLKPLFSSPAIIKAGIDVFQDILKLREQLPCAYENFVDIGRMARDAGLKNFSMRALAAVLLGVRIPKTMRTSNWARQQLTPQQITYAATDAWISRCLYLQLADFYQKHAAR
ncbi:MAG: 3'-5' exonuclease domain-containing protein 2 [Desulfobacterota bacterium]|nr:3'-5' exonuclease domain-containing protein 2 [Thermodesulfobacteriota bacterium]